jgi:acetolactate synthase-1/2/3 large subunit
VNQSQSTPPYRIVRASDGADAFVEALVTYGVEYIFINSGTDTFPIQEALAKRLEKGLPYPQVILCLDESMGLSAAQGYFQITGKPQVVLVHVDAGTAQLGGALHNAQRSRAGVLICAGRSPYTFLNEVPGGRDLPIHWIQEQRDQSGIVRTFTKWDYELRSAEITGFVVQRALQVAAAQPAGPVYLVLPRESLMQPIQEVTLPEPSRHVLPTTSSGDPDALRAIADILLGADSPLIIPGLLGRDRRAVDALIDLAEAVGARVATGPTRMSFPTDHPLWVGMNAHDHLPNADVVLVVDSDVPWIPAQAQPRPDATIAWIDIEPVKESMPLWSFPGDLVVQADSAKALPLLAADVKKRVTADQALRAASRVTEITAETRARLQRLEQEDEALRDTRPIAPQWLIRCLAEALPPEALVLEETVTNRPRLHEVLPRTRSGEFLVSGGASLGWAIGAAVGAKLAAPERDAIALVGDGAFIYGAPTSALWAAGKYKAPFLTVIFNNSEHFSTRRSLQTFYPDSAAQRTNTFMGLDIDPSPEYAQLAEASHAYGERVDDPSDVLPAIQRGLVEIRNGRAAVIDVRLRRP